MVTRLPCIVPIGTTEENFVAKRYLSDEIFDRLAATIVRGEAAPGTFLPSEHTLSIRFGASRIVVRQALHRLMELGLVRCRQGGKTEVLDPNMSGDIQVIGLLYQHAEAAQGVGAMHDVIEKQCLQGLTMIEIASRRATDESLAALAERVYAFANASADETSFDAFEEYFWRALATSGGNRVLISEVDWWYRALPKRIRSAASRATPMLVRQGLYREIAGRLQRRDQAAEYYLAVMTPWLKALPDMLRASAVEPSSHDNRMRPQLRVVASRETSVDKTRSDDA